MTQLCSLCGRLTITPILTIRLILTSNDASGQRLTGTIFPHLPCVSLTLSPYPRCVILAISPYPPCVILTLSPYLPCNTLSPYASCDTLTLSPYSPCVTLTFSPCPPCVILTLSPYLPCDTLSPYASCDTLSPSPPCLLPVSPYFHIPPVTPLPCPVQVCLDPDEDEWTIALASCPSDPCVSPTAQQARYCARRMDIAQER